MPETYTGIQRTKATGLEVLMVMLRRLTYPNRWCGLVPLFTQSESELSIIINTVGVYFVYYLP